MTQEDQVTPIIFNVVVEAVVRAVLLEVYGSQEAQHCILYRQLPNRGVQPHLGAEDTDSNGKDVQEGGTSDRPCYYQSNHVHPGFRLGPTGDSGMQEERDGRGGHALGVE